MPPLYPTKKEVTISGHSTTKATIRNERWIKDQIIPSKHKTQEQATCYDNLG
jgi:hypothetical protein